MTTNHSPHAESVRKAYRAFADANRAAFEALLSEQFTFSSPADTDLDRRGYFERCWPNAGMNRDLELIRLIESDDEVLVTYESSGCDGRRARNTEIFTFEDGRIASVEVYFGCSVC